MKIVLLARPGSNPYLNLLSSAINNQREDFKIFWYSEDIFRNLVKGKENFVLHIHWPNILYSSNQNFLRSFIIVLDFFSLIREAKKNKLIRIVWTVHNYESHDANALIDIFCYRIFFRIVDAFIVHTIAGKQFLEKKGVNARKIHIIAHPSYVNYYGNQISSFDARKKLNIDQHKIIFLSFGLLRKYKNIENLIKIFNAITKTERDIQLFIIGEKKGDDNSLISKIASKNIFFQNRYIPEDEVALWVSCADFFIMAHDKPLTSGGAILALSYGLPVIAPNCGDLPYVIKDAFNGFLYDEEEFSMLISRAIKIARTENSILSQMRVNAKADLFNISWENAGKETIKIYEFK